jgi:hypothetical protein
VLDFKPVTALIGITFEALTMEISHIYMSGVAGKIIFCGHAPLVLGGQRALLCGLDRMTLQERHNNATSLQSTILNRMKTAYELAMERLNQTAPTVKLTGAQKKQLAELDSKYAAKIAEREIALRDGIAKVAAAGDAEKAGELQQQLVKERKSLQAGLEEKKEQVRQNKR